MRKKQPALVVIERLARKNNRDSERHATVACAKGKIIENRKKETM